MTARSDRWKQRGVFISIVSALAGLGLIVFNSGRGVGRLDSIAEDVKAGKVAQVETAKQLGHVLEELAMHSVKLEMARQDRERVEAKVQLVAEALASRNRWSNKASDDVLRRLDALNHKGTDVLENRP